MRARGSGKNTASLRTLVCGAASIFHWPLSLSLSLSLAYAIDLIDSDVSHIYPSIYLFISRGIRSAATWLFIIAVSGHLSRNGFISETETRGLDLARSRAIDKRYTNR